MKLEKKLCHNAPFYVLGPLVWNDSTGTCGFGFLLSGFGCGVFGSGYVVWDLWCLSSLFGDLWLGTFGFGSLDSDLWLGIFGLLVWFGTYGA